jgi:glycerophosphoryl diester phosphodiesterase
MRRLLPAALVALALAVPSATPAAPAPCSSLPDPTRWLSAGTPDTGQPRPLIMPHRGGGYLAPEETIDAYEVSLAYGADGFEGDLQVSKDGRYVLSHDDSLGRLANNGNRDGGPLDPKIADHTLAKLETYNVANHDLFAASAPPNPHQAYNPAHVIALEDALALAERYHVGMDLDLKNVPDPADLVNLVARYPHAFARTFFEADPHEVVEMRQVQPDVNAMYNVSGEEPPGTMYELTQPPFSYRYFGSALSKFTPERVAEMHDGCALAIPHDYDDPPADEYAALRQGRANGTDGAQVNHVEIATEVYGRPVKTLIRLHGRSQACLVNANRRPLGLPYKTLRVGGSDLVTLKRGCVDLPPGLPAGTAITFAGDAQALASSETLE